MRLALLDEEHALDSAGRLWVRLASRWELGEGDPGAAVALPADDSCSDCDDEDD
ncbi:MAG: hypothetical protein ACJ79H_03535 [Myxococcales bacterium]